MKINPINTIYFNNFKVKQKLSFGNCQNDSFESTIKVKGSETEAKIYTANVDYETLDAIRNMCNHPVFKDAPIRIMPDTHAGKNSVVGFSAPVGAAGTVIPNIVGGDIGCGMLCVKLDTGGKEIDCRELDNVIRKFISSSRSEIPKSFSKVPVDFIKQVDGMTSKKYKQRIENVMQTLGTIGGGNHFIEIDKDDNGDYYLVIHSGSRLFGKEVADYHQEKANRQNPYKIKELSYLSGAEAKDYLEDMGVAVEFSSYNRRVIADEIISRMGWREVSSFESLHNYISDDGMIRKGAISAEKGEELLIPLNMRDGAIIGSGKGNEDWNNTAPHGSGRQYKRREVKDKFTLEDFRETMKGVYSTCISSATLSEAPQAYKSSEEIIENIADSVNVEKIITPVYNYKD